MTTLKRDMLRNYQKNELPKTSPITNHIPHLGVLNVQKRFKVRVVFDAAAIYHETRLNNNLLLGMDFLKNIVSVLSRFRQGAYATCFTMFHQVSVPSPDTDPFRHLRRKGIAREIEQSDETKYIW